MDKIEMDVLIIGGGVFGLWLLNDLRRQGYTAYLLEQGQLGGAQTCHSHVYIHQGYMYSDAHLARSLSGTTELWKKWLTENHRHPVFGSAPSYFGFANNADAERRRDFWNTPELRLEHEPVPVPSFLIDGVVRVVFKTPEQCLDGHWLTRELATNVNSFISKIESVYAIRLHSPVRHRDNTVEEVEVMINSGERLVFRPTVLILAAGAGNQSLLHLISAGNSALLGSVQGSQQIRKAHMLVVKGYKERLIPLTGVFPDTGGLFIVARQLGESVVWLVSDNQSPAIWFPDQWVTHSAAEWLKGVLAALARLAPRYFDKPEASGFQWGVYEAPKAEGRAEGALPSELRIEQFGIRNLWTVWPSKLTLAPTASQQVLEELQQTDSPLGKPTGQVTCNKWVASRTEVPVAQELWRKSILSDWVQFSTRYLD